MADSGSQSDKRKNFAMQHGTPQASSACTGADISADQREILLKGKQVSDQPTEAADAKEVSAGRQAPTTALHLNVSLISFALGRWYWPGTWLRSIVSLWLGHSLPGVYVFG